MANVRGSLIVLLSAAVAGCTSFGSVRTAEVHPGPSVMLQASISTPPGDRTAWFWSLDCAFDCNHSIPGGELGLTLGHAKETGPAFALGAGLSGIVYPYVDGYVQLGRGYRPYGVGARIGIPAGGWTEHSLYGRYDIPIDGERRLLFNPALFFHGGNSPNGENPGRFLALIQGIGYLIEGENVSFGPAASLVIGRGERESYTETIGPFWTVFAKVSISIVYHGSRD